MSIFGGIPDEELVKLYKKAGINRTFIGAEHPDFDAVMKLYKDNDIICETLHAPFNKINDIWTDTPAGEDMLNRLLVSVDRCVKNNIPILVVHLSSKTPMPQMTDVGKARFAELVEYADKNNVVIAFENQRYMENLEYAMKAHPTAGFCWDNGHESCFTPGMHFMPYFGDRLVCLHMQDNCGEYDKDNHVLPFDGNIDFEEVAKSIADSGFDGTVMLEVTKNARYNGEMIYENLTTEEYVERAATSVRKLADMIDKYKEEKKNA